MAQLDITDDHVDVHLTRAEKFFALRGDYRVARRDVESVEVFVRITLTDERYRAVVIGVDDPGPIRAALTG